MRSYTILMPLLALLLPISVSAATITYNVTVDTSSVAGTAGSLDLNFNPGPLVVQPASLQISNFSTDGSVGSGAVLTGDVSGSLPSGLTFDNGTAFNDYFGTFTYGSTLSFSLIFSGEALNAPDGMATSGSTAALSMFSDPGGSSPVLTNDTADGFAFTINVNLDGATRINGFSPFTNYSPAPLVAAVLPGSRSVVVGTEATVFATLLNAATTALNNCSISLPYGSSGDLSLDYQTTDPATNALTGQPDQPVPLAANGSLTFVLSFGADSALSAPALAPVFGCDNVGPTAVIPGVDTLDLNFSTTPAPDIIAIAVATGGILTIPQSTGGTGAFAAASIDAGTADTITVSTDTGAANLPINAAICPTNPSTAACLSPPSSSVQALFQPNGTQTYSVFATASAPIPFAPGTARVFVTFTDSTGTLRGLTSVAVRTN
jgi:hypothetical protein